MNARKIKRIFFLVFCVAAPVCAVLNFKKIWIALFYRETPEETIMRDLISFTDWYYIIMAAGLAFLVFIAGLILSHLLSEIIIRLVFGRKQSLMRSKLKELIREGHSLYTLTETPLTEEDKKFVVTAARYQRMAMVIIGSIFFVISIFNIIFFGVYPAIVTFVFGCIGASIIHFLMGRAKRNWNTAMKENKKYILRGVITEKWGAEGEVYIFVSTYSFLVDHKTYNEFELGDAIEIHFVKLPFQNIIISKTRIEPVSIPINK